jgi:hypothetical protein
MRRLLRLLREPEAELGSLAGRSDRTLSKKTHERLADRPPIGAEGLHKFAQVERRRR